MAYLGKTRDPLMFYQANLGTIVLARNLRHAMTKSEKVLWHYLRRKYVLGYKFRRQQPIGYYIADFYCHELMLVIEVDGPIHMRKDRQEHDRNRTAVMERFGIEVIRFTNQDVKDRIDWVIESIREHIRSKIPPPLQGEGRGGVEQV